MRFKTSFLITLLFHLAILVVDKGGGFVILYLLKEQPKLVGGLHLLMNLHPMLVAVSNLGLAASIVYFTRRKQVDVAVAGQTTSFVALVWGFTVALLALGVLSVVTLLHPAFGIPSWGLILPVLALPTFMLITSYRNCIQLTLGKIVAYNFVHLVPSLTYLPSFLLIYFWISDRDPLYSAVYARFIPAVFLALGLIWVLRKVVPARPRLDLAFLKKALGFGWRANIHSTLTVLNHRIDLYLVGGLYAVSAFLPESEQTKLIAQQVAYYSVAVTFAELIWHLPEALRDIMFAKVAGLDEQEAREFTPVVARNSLAICIMGAVMVWLLHAPVMELILGDAWTRKWSGVTPALAWLLPGTALYTIAKILQSDLMARNYFRICNWMTALVLVVMLVLDLVLVPGMGARGAAIASTCAYAAGALGTIRAYIRSTGSRMRDLLLIQREDWQHYRPILARIGLGGRSGAGPE